MGLASYGDASRLFQKIPKEKWMKEMNGHYVCNPKIEYIGSLQLSFRYLYHRLLKSVRSIVDKTDHVAFESITFPFPQRPRDYALPDKTYSDVAAAVQDIIEDIFLGLSRRVHAATGSKNLCIAGGCGLNGVSNNKILLDKKFEGVFVQPASSDTGIPLGCALWGYHAHLNMPRTYVMTHASLGRTYSEEEIKEAINGTVDILFTKSKNVANDTAELLEQQKIIGWFQGGSEYGPRALGNRSIICDPRRLEMKDILNKRVKHREMWRPFAASVLKEYVHDYFELPYHESPFMLLVPEIRKDVQNKIHAAYRP
jgi:carbamoyltransferase